MNEFEDHNDFSGAGGIEQVDSLKPNSGAPSGLDSFWVVIRVFNDVYFDLDKRTPQAVRKDLEEGYEALKVIGAVHGISALSIPQLKLCCGRSRPGEPVPVGKSWGVGDLIKKLTTFLGIRQCPECKKRQTIFNRWRLRP